MEISTPKQLESYLNYLLTNIVNGIAKEIEKVLKENIQKYIYDSYDPVPEYWGGYERTYQFRDNAWVLQTAKEISNKIVASVDYFPQGMVYNPDKSQHGSPYGLDRRNSLAQILNRGTTDWNGWDYGRSNGTYPQPFFTITVKWIEDNWNKLASKYFKMNGIKDFQIK